MKPAVIWHQNTGNDIYSVIFSGAGPPDTCYIVSYALAGNILYDLSLHVMNPGTLSGFIIIVGNTDS